MRRCVSLSLSPLSLSLSLSLSPPTPLSLLTLPLPLMLSLTVSLSKGCAPGGTNYEFLSRVPYTSALWTKKYGEKLANILNDDICKPKCLPPVDLFSTPHDMNAHLPIIAL